MFIFLQTGLTVSKNVDHPDFTTGLTNAVLPICSVFIALVADALEGAESVDALSIPAHLALQSGALIDVCREKIKKIRILIFSWHQEQLKTLACVLFSWFPG